MNKFFTKMLVLLLFSATIAFSQDKNIAVGIGVGLNRGINEGIQDERTIGPLFSVFGIFNNGITWGLTGCVKSQMQDLFSILRKKYIHFDLATPFIILIATPCQNVDNFMIYIAFSSCLLVNCFVFLYCKNMQI